MTLALNQENKGSLSPSIKINIIHENSDGGVTKAKISDEGYKQWHYKYKDLIELKAEGNLSEKEKISQRREKIKDFLGKGLTRKDIYTQIRKNLQT